MNKKNRLRKNSDFKRIYSKGKSLANRFLVVYYLKNNLDVCRVGIPVSKKFGKSVKRNKLKRRIREAARMCLDKIEKGYDIIIIPRKMARDVNFWIIKKALINLLLRANIAKGCEKSNVRPNHN